MKISETELKGVYLISPEIYEDFRGAFVETYNEEKYREHGIAVKFVQDDLSISDHNVLRGLHGDGETYKLVSCVYGKIYLVVVNCDEKSDEYRKWQSFTLSAESRKQIFIPPNFANGYYVLSEKAIFSYKQSTDYVPGKQFSYKWNDPQLGIWWPCKTPLLSERDA